MKVLVTGGAGFIGSHLVEALLARGHKVDVVDNFSTGKIEYLRKADGITIMEANVQDIVWREYQLFQYDQIFHLAAVVGVKRVLENPLETIESNLEGTKRLLDALSHLPTDRQPRLFLASTSEVYGKNDKWALSENDDRITGSTKKSRWVYAETKAMDEFLAHVYSEVYGLRVVIGRFFSIVGPRQVSQYGMVLPKFVEQALANKPITVYGDGTQIRSFLHVYDCVAQILTLMDPAEENQINNAKSMTFNIGNPDPIMIKDLAWRVKHWAKSSSEIVYVPYEKAYADTGFEDMMRRVPDVSLYRGLTGDTCINRDLDAIIQDTIEYYRGKQ